MRRTNWMDYVTMDKMQPQGPYDGRYDRDMTDSRRGVRGSGRGRDRYDMDMRDFADMDYRYDRDMRDYRYNRDMRMDYGMDYGMDYEDRRRNPYGSKGGYVTSSRRDRSDGEDMRDYRNDMEYNSRYDSRDYDMEQRDRNYNQQDNARYDSNYDGHMGYNMPYYYPFNVRGTVGSRMYEPYNYQDHRDYASSDKYLSEDDIKEWEGKLMNHIEEKDKMTFKKDMVLKKAQDLGIKFEKFTPEEFYITVLMMYTDYCKTLGSGNVDVYLKLAKDWLNDDDIKKKYSEKLSTYYNKIVEGK